ncbi:MAG: DNA mismatch repair protein MutL, partial [Rhodospirillaceae bacterium]|nr:DNA mismatch repair protein MutL [Rhodospirillaceae bacterium]
MTVRILPPNLVNQIAAGEVVERPASVVKELVENALDAGARHVDVTMNDGGRSLIVVADDGRGMDERELAFAIERHATSKLPDDDLTEIGFFGFRGEALPSIGAVARLTITSRPRDATSAWYIRVEGGRREGPVPTPHPPGTRVEVRDLFFATPARLKFLKAARTELNHAVDTIERLAMANPTVAFTLTADGRARVSLEAEGGDLFDARLARLGAIMGKDFVPNAVKVTADRGGLRLTGYAGVPTYNRGNALA